jgi:23S rRNA-/tRNA-specific pseudouridylate synthase
MRRFVVRPGDGSTISDLLANVGEPVRAVGEGRVFVGARRVADPGAPIRPGDEIVVHAAQASIAGVRIVSEFRGVLAVHKPAGLPTEPDRRGGASVVRSVAAELGLGAGALHAATRLDAAVSGLVVLARGPDARRRAAAWKASGALGRRYVALASGFLAPPVGTWDSPIGMGPGGQRRVGGAGAKPATTRYRALESIPLEASAVTFAVLEPVTGRTHQLRIHAAAAGAPLVGDVLYGGPRRLVLPSGAVLTLSRVALHAARIDVRERGRPVWSAIAPLDEDVAALWLRLGGSERVLAAALESPSLDSEGGACE